MAERTADFIHDRNAIADQADRHAGLQQNKTGADFLHERAGRRRQDQTSGHEHVAELHANAVHRGWIVNKLELQLEGDLNITAVWGTGDVSEKPVGFTDVRVKVDMVCEGIPQSEIDALVTHVKKWSPVANTFSRPVNLEVSA